MTKLLNETINVTIYEFEFINSTVNIRIIFYYSR